MTPTIKEGVVKEESHHSPGSEENSGRDCKGSGGKTETQQKGGGELEGREGEGEEDGTEDCSRISYISRR